MSTTNTTPQKNIEMIEEGKLSHYRVSYNKWNQKILVPVVDVRDGIVERMVAESIIKSANRSMYISYNQYHQSRKTKTNI